jgi:3-oxoacyl-[acyl-carrier protein] reductase
MDLGIEGKRVLVTGASQGLGRAVALSFAQEGCRVAVVSRNAEKLRALTDEMSRDYQNEHAWYASDLLVSGSPTLAVQALTAQGGTFDIVVHNVGGTLNQKNPLTPLDQWNKVWQYNAGIAIEINNLVIPPMLEKGWGRIIHISSISAESLRGSTPYAASKAFLNAYVKGVGRSFAPKGIILSAIMPGAFLSEGGHWDKIKKENPEMMHDFLRHHHAIGRLGTPEEIVPFVLFMASQYVTFAAASIIPVDGGTM